MRRGHALSYSKPTLVETFAEIHLAPETLTEARFFEVVPKLKDAGFTEIEFATVGVSLEVKPGRSVPVPRDRQRVRCWKPGKTQLVQVGEDLLVVNLTGEYPGWDGFVALFNEAYEALEAGLGQVEVQSLNLLTIDLFRVSKERFSISKYLNTNGEAIPKWFADCRESVDMNLGRGLLQVDGHNRQVHVNVQAATDPVSVRFQAQFHERVEAGSDLMGVLERLHGESNMTFESLITDRVRKDIMGGLAT